MAIRTHESDEHLEEEFVVEGGQPRILDPYLASLKDKMAKVEPSSNEFHNLVAEFHAWLAPPELGGCVVEPSHPYSSSCVLSVELMPTWYKDYLDGYEAQGHRTFQADYCTNDALVALGTLNTPGPGIHATVTIEEVILAPPTVTLIRGTNARIGIWGADYLLGRFPSGTRLVVCCPRSEVQYKSHLFIGRTAQLPMRHFGAVLGVGCSEFLLFPLSDPTYFPTLNSLCVGRHVVVPWLGVRQLLATPKGTFVDHRPRRFWMRDTNE